MLPVIGAHSTHTCDELPQSSLASGPRPTPPNGPESGGLARTSGLGLYSNQPKQAAPVSELLQDLVQ